MWLTSLSVFSERPMLFSPYLKIFGRRICGCFGESVCHVIPLKFPHRHCGNLTECHFCVSWFALLSRIPSSWWTNHSRDVTDGPPKIQKIPNDRPFMTIWGHCSARPRFAAYPWLLNTAETPISHKHHRFKTTFRGFYRFICLLFIGFFVVAR